MNMMFDMMDIAMKPGRLNGRRMKNMEKKMAKKYEQQMVLLVEFLCLKLF